MSLMHDSLVLARKDLLIELRARHAVTAAATLGGIALILVGLAVGPDVARLRQLAPALVWIVLLYGTLAVADRLDSIDRADDAFSGLWLVLDDRRAIYLGRVLSMSGLLMVLQLTLWLGALVLLDLRTSPIALLLVPLAGLSAVAMSSVTALVTTMVGHASHRALLQPVLLMPLLVPVFLAGVQASAATLGARTSELPVWAAATGIEASLFLGIGLVAYEAAARPE